MKRDRVKKEEKKEKEAAREREVEGDRQEALCKEQLYRDLRDYAATLCETHARTLEHMNLTSEAFRESLALVEYYRADMAQRTRAIGQRIASNGSPDGSISWDTVRGFHRSNA